MKDPLKRFTIAITGDFGSARTHDKMKQWIQVNGATFASEISAKVTHLICSKKHFIKEVAMVQQARKLKAVKIVSFDWLEDSLMKMSSRNEDEYLMGPRLRMAARTKEKKSRVRKANIKKGMDGFEKGCKAFQKAMCSDGYHIYQDLTDFAYDITLVRANLLNNRNERFTLKLYVSYSVPKFYACYVKYSAPDITEPAKVLAPLGSSFELALSTFQDFFKLKTKKGWDARMVKADMGEEAFLYTPPREGEPRGLSEEWYNKNVWGEE